MASDQHDEVSCLALTPVFTLLGKRWSGLIIDTLRSSRVRRSAWNTGLPRAARRSGPH